MICVFFDIRYGFAGTSNGVYAVVQVTERVATFAHWVIPSCR
ncbi:Uncharacterised protein [Vibrio cholerae]|nr:Uncharacterised protein [Vibrio cholerae]CSI37408.1 Uncharacterised protein [Vibrio cholerae]CSI68679.1 Uncharacterised protein [Vibrio cholerae]